MIKQSDAETVYREIERAQFILQFPISTKKIQRQSYKKKWYVGRQMQDR